MHTFLIVYHVFLWVVLYHSILTPVPKVLELQAQLEQSKRTVTELKRHCRHVTSDLQDARVLIDSLQARTHDLDRKQRRCVASLHAKCHISIEVITIHMHLIYRCHLFFFSA